MSTGGRWSGGADAVVEPAVTGFDWYLVENEGVLQRSSPWRLEAAESMVGTASLLPRPSRHLLVLRVAAEGAVVDPGLRPVGAGDAV